MQSDNLLPEAPGDPVVSEEPIILEASLPVIDGVNWSHAKGGLTEGALPDRKQWTDALKQFAKEAPAVAEQMEAQYREGAYDEVGRRVHTMKEAAEAWGADSLAVLAHYLEQAIQDNHRERMDCLIELFSAEWRRLGAAVSAYFENR